MAHHNTVFHQMVKFIPRYRFNQAVRKHQGDYRVRSFGCWSHFVCLLYAQLTRQVSLRDLEEALRSKGRRLHHLGVSYVCRSTLADANQRRSPLIFQETFGILYNQCLTRAPHHKFSFKNPLYTLDSTTIGLCLSLFQWAKFRKRKGAVKIHSLLDHRGHIPEVDPDSKLHPAVFRQLSVPGLELLLDLHSTPDSGHYPVLLEGKERTLIDSSEDLCRVPRSDLQGI